MSFDLTINESEKDLNFYTKNKLYIYGLLIYILVFAIIIPYIIYKFKWYFFLGLYFINIDLLASVLSFQGGPFNTNIFKHLYNDSQTLIGYISFNIINLVVLLGIAYTIIKIAQENNSIEFGVAVSLFIYTITYLFPQRIINTFMNNFYKYLDDNFDIANKYGHNLQWFIVFLFGLLLVKLFILFEKVSINFFAVHVSNFIKNFIFKL